MVLTDLLVRPRTHKSMFLFVEVRRKSLLLSVHRSLGGHCLPDQARPPSSRPRPLRDPWLPRRTGFTVPTLDPVVPKHSVSGPNRQ